MRRLRRTEGLRALCRETSLTAASLIQPLFVVHGQGAAEEIGAMPGQRRWSIDRLVGECERLAELGVGGILLFGIPAVKDELGSEAYAPDGIIARALQAVKCATPELTLMADVCLCEYTSHGHCGVVAGGRVDNDPSLELLARAAVVYAEAGADVVAPSDMMDGRVAAIRRALDDQGHLEVAILSYAVKYASAFYGPFREAAGSTPQFGDRRGYQMDPANGREALREVALDLEEGADAVMVKPALPYLDVIARVRAACDAPLAAYQVSGEYAQIKAAAAQGWLDEARVVEESLVAIRRAGADMILTYFAADFAHRRRS